MNNTSYSYAEADAAVCLTEAINDEEYDDIESYKLNHGIAALRHDIITDCAPKLEAAYQAAISKIGEHGHCFDLEIVPSILKDVFYVEKTHLASLEVWNKSALKTLWLLEFNSYMESEYSNLTNNHSHDDEDIFIKWGMDGRTSYEVAAINYTNSLKNLADSKAMNRLNIIYQKQDLKILSIHNTPTLCDEELSSYYRSNSDKHQSDRSWNQISVPFDVNKEEVIGSKLSDWL